MIKILLTLFTFLWVLFLAWYGGNDFDQRSLMSAYWVFGATLSAVFVWGMQSC